MTKTVFAACDYGNLTLFYQNRIAFCQLGQKVVSPYC